jgi:hypothetical protein
MRRGEWEVRVFFMKRKEEMIERTKKWSGRISRAHRKALNDMAEQHRENVLKEWEEKVKYADLDFGKTGNLSSGRGFGVYYRTRFF